MVTLYKLFFLCFDSLVYKMQIMYENLHENFYFYESKATK